MAVFDSTRGSHRTTQIQSARHTSVKGGPRRRLKVGALKILPIRKPPNQRLTELRTFYLEWLDQNTMSVGDIEEKKFRISFQLSSDKKRSVRVDSCTTKFCLFLTAFRIFEAMKLVALTKNEMNPKDSRPKREFNGSSGCNIEFYIGFTQNSGCSDGAFE